MSFIDADDMIHGSPLHGWSGRFFHSENMTFGHWDIADDAVDVHEHDHPQEEVWNVVDGEVVLVVDGKEQRLGPGSAAVVPPNVRHAAKAIGACRVVVVDYPLRLDLPGMSHPK